MLEKENYVLVLAVITVLLVGFIGVTWQVSQETPTGSAIRLNLFKFFKKSSSTQTQTASSSEGEGSQAARTPTNTQSQVAAGTGGIPPANEGEGQQTQFIDLVISPITISHNDPRVGDTIYYDFDLRNKGNKVATYGSGGSISSPRGGYGYSSCCSKIEPGEIKYFRSQLFVNETGNWSITFSAGVDGDVDINPTDNLRKVTFYVRP